jgi:hypothetical protein
MIAQGGTDSLLRVDHSTGVMTGCDITNWVLLNKGALFREPRLKIWLKQVTRGMHFCTLTPEGWFTEGHGYGNYIWAPPPTAHLIPILAIGYWFSHTKFVKFAIPRGIAAGYTNCTENDTNRTENDTMSYRRLHLVCTVGKRKTYCPNAGYTLYSKMG